MNTDYINNEINRFENNNSNIRMIRPEYDREEDLNNDWEIFNNLPYHLRALANEKAIYLYGIRNEDLYSQHKKKFAKYDIEQAEYLPYDATMSEDTNMVDIDFKNNIAIDFMRKTGHQMVLANVKSEQELERQWKAFFKQCHHHKVICNNKSIELYGKNVPDMYRMELKKFLKRDIPNASYDTSIGYNPDMQDSDKSSSGFETPIDPNINECNIIDSILDPIEKAIMLNEASKHSKGPVVFSMISNTAYSFKKTLGKKPKIKVYSSHTYMVPKEVLDLHEDINIYQDPLFINSACKYYGIASDNKLIKEESNLIMKNPQEATKIGFNPSIAYIKDYSYNEVFNINNERYNKVLNDNLPDFNYIDLSYTDGLYEGSNKHKGLSIITISETDIGHKVNDDIPKLLISFDPNDEKWLGLTRGEFILEYSIPDIVSKYHYPTINYYFIEMEDSLYDNKEKLISSFNENESIFNTIHRYKEETCPIINNSLLYTIRLVEELLLPYSNNNFSLYYLYNNIDSLHEGISFNYDFITEAFSRINILEEYDKYTNTTFLQDTFNPKILNEVDTLPIEFDEDGNLFIKRSESLDFAAEYSKCHKLLLQYDKVHNYEAMKYYVAKLWYMNILIEKKIHTPKMSPQLKEKLPYYYKTRAHILNDFNTYIGKILENDKDFNFEEYYKQTPFDKSTVKVSRNLLQKLWDILKAILMKK